MSVDIARAYDNAFTAYGAIHAALSYAVEAALEDCDYDDAIKYAEMMLSMESKGYKCLDTSYSLKPPKPYVKG